MTCAPDEHEALLEAVRATGLHVMRGMANADRRATATEYLRRSVVPTAHGWGNGVWCGSTRPKGYWISHGYDQPGILVPWWRIAEVILPTWDPELIRLYDHARELEHKLHDACHANEWPRGGDDYYRILRGAHAADQHIRATMLNRIPYPGTQLELL
jgi:hypothetical protein